MIPLPPVGDASQTSRLADDLAMAIHLGDVAPGTPLREIEIAEANGVSRTIVRAALQRLEAQGLAEITLNKGARVKHPSPATLADMMELHASLAAFAARHAAERADTERVADIRIFAEMLEHVAEDGGAAREFQHLRVGFMRALFEAAGPALAERLRSAAPVTPHHEHSLDDVSDTQGQTEAAKLAHDVLRAIEVGAPEAAAKAAERLIRRHAERTLGRSHKPAPRSARTAA